MENRWVKGKCVQRHLRYLGREANGQTLLSASLSEVEVDQVKLYGPLLVLNHLAGEIRLAEELGAYGQEILSMVYAHCVDYRSLNQMTGWFERTDLNVLLHLEGLTEKRLLSALDSLESLDADAWQRQLFERVCQRYRLQPTGVIYDVTNTYLYGQHCALAKVGRDKEGVRGRPLIQVALAVTQAEGFPLFHKAFDGNIHDTRTLQDLVSLFSTYHLERGLFIYDRGITSGRNLQDIKRLDWDTLCGVPLRPELKQFWRPQLVPQQLLQLSHRQRVRHAIFYTLQRPYRLDGVRGHLVLCLNERQQLDLRESRREEVLYAQQRLQEGKSIKAGLESYFDHQGRLRTRVLAQAEEFDGCSCLFCTRALAPQTMLSLYFGKDLIDKAFRSLKGITQLRPIRHWLSERVRAHVFLCYLSYLLLSLLEYRLRQSEFSAEAALLELETMYKVYLRDRRNRFHLSRIVTLTKKQERILRCIDPTLLDRPSV